MKKLITLATLLIALMGAAHAQDKFDYKLVKEIVDNERNYFNDITKLYIADDKLLRIDDIALVYYGQSYLPSYNAGNDINEKSLKSFVAEGNNKKTYETATKILTYNHVSLNALFYAWLSSQARNRSIVIRNQVPENIGDDYNHGRRQKQQNPLPSNHPR